MSVERWLACDVCRALVPDTELTADERDEWMETHTEQTGHDAWGRVDVTVED